MVFAEDGAPHLRLATEDDLPSLAAMAEAALPEAWPLPLMEEALRLDHHRMVVAEAHGSVGSDRVVGYLLASLVVPDAIELLQVVVAPNCRRSGIATALMHWLGARCLAGGRILLEVRGSNRAAVRLYRRLGFRQLATRHHYYRPAAPSTAREDALVMAFTRQ
ncbi:MAG: GNAT family N-acetyltransferase [Mariprofundales bacterium]|nr:GNAT family N-acetyltransferase [Mariprofundales bacterium]